MAQVFISYARADRARVEPIVDALKAVGVTVWWDVELRTGSVFREIINKRLQAADCIVSFWTYDSISSKWVLDEADYAAQHSKLFSVKLDPVDTPIGLRQIQTHDLTGSNDAPSAELDRFIADLLHFLAELEPRRKTSRTVAIPLSTTSIRTHAQLVARVATLYEGLGFRVIPSHKVEGAQYDLLASRHLAGSGIISILVAVIHTFSQWERANLDSILGRLPTRATSNVSPQIVIVSLEPAPVDIQHSLGKLHHVHLLSLPELENELLNISESMSKVVQEYKQRKIFLNYIPISGTTPTSQSTIRDVSSFLLQEAHKRGDAIVLFGDFGSGKTTILERVFFEAADSHIRSPTTLIPIFIRLRGLLHYADLWEFIRANLRDHLYIQPTKTAFFDLLEAGRFLILMDGFDEIHTGATATERGQYLAKLLPLILSPSPCILSSRPTYFDSLDEMLLELRRQLEPRSSVDGIPQQFDLARDIAANYEIHLATRIRARDFGRTIELNGLSDVDVSEYLRNNADQIKAATGQSYLDLFQQLKAVYDLSDLMKRPLLLDMIVETITRMKIDFSHSTHSIGPAFLYENYTQLALLRDANKSALGQFLDPKERTEACRHLAIFMLETGALELTARDVEIALRRAPFVRRMLKRSKDDLAIERIKTDIRTCSFLVFAQDGGLRFAHKSFFEFFVAQAFRIGAKDRALLQRVSAQTLSAEIIYFLGSYARDLKEYRQWVFTKIKTARNDLLLNILLRTAFAAGRDLEALKLRSRRVSNVEMARATVSAARFDALELVAVSLRDVTLVRTRMEGCSLINSTWRRIAFDSGICELLMNDVSWIDVRGNNQVFVIDGADWEIQRGEFAHCAITLRGRGTLADLALSHCSISFEDWGGTLGGKLSVSESVISGKLGKKWISADDALKAREFETLIGRVNRVKETGIVFDNCVGVILVDYDILSLSSSEKELLRVRWPDLLFWERDAVMARDGRAKDGKYKKSLEEMNWFRSVWDSGSKRKAFEEILWRLGIA